MAVATLHVTARVVNDLFGEVAPLTSEFWSASSEETTYRQQAGELRCGWTWNIFARVDCEYAHRWSLQTTTGTRAVKRLLYATSVPELDYWIASEKCDV